MRPPFGKEDSHESQKSYDSSAGFNFGKIMGVFNQLMRLSELCNYFTE